MADIQNSSENTTGSTTEKVKKNSDSDSSSDDEPVVKKKSTTVRGIRNLKAKCALSTSNVPKRDCHVFSGGISERLSAFRHDLARNTSLGKDADDSEDINEEMVEEKVAETKKPEPVKNTVEDITKDSDDELEVISKDSDDELEVISTERPKVKDDVVFLEEVEAVTQTPPPLPAYLKRKKVRRAKATTTAIASLQNLNSYHKLSEIRDRLEDRSSGVIMIAEDQPSQREIMMKVRSRSGIQRFPMKPNDRFIDVMKAMASHEGVNLSDIVMSVSGRDTAIQYQDTIVSLNLNIADIVECHIKKKSRIPVATEEVDDDNIISIKLQGKESHSKLTLKTDVFVPLENIMRQYAKEKNLVFEKLKFKFDDELITPAQSADELEMTDDDCIDVIS